MQTRHRSVRLSMNQTRWRHLKYASEELCVDEEKLRPTPDKDMAIWRKSVKEVKHCVTRCYQFRYAAIELHEDLCVHVQSKVLFLFMGGGWVFCLSGSRGVYIWGLMRGGSFIRHWGFGFGEFTFGV